MLTTPQTSASARLGGCRCWTRVSCSTWRRRSFIGSTERMRGMTSKLCSGGGDVVYHSSVFAFHGSGPATRPS